MMKTMCLLYAVGDFAGMVWTGYHSLFTIASFWLALALLYALASHAQHQRTRKHYDTLMRAMREVRE